VAHRSGCELILRAVPAKRQRVTPAGSRNQSVINRYAGHNAIVLDGALEETPYIDYTDRVLSQGIVGNAQITEPSAAVAARTALVLRSGSLPYTFKQVERSNCSR
jgi:preprotein translocase subunit SecD